jgi:hypothetical protein
MLLNSQLYDKLGFPFVPCFPGQSLFFIKMSRVNFKSPAFSKYPSVFLLINVIWTDEKTDLKLRQ